MGRSQTPKRPVTILFGDSAAELFEELPEDIKHEARQSMELLMFNPRMYQVRRRGIMRGRRAFLAGRYFFCYLVSSAEIRIDAILPAGMRRT
jgi:plasmid stabilization system protein ParE